MVSSSNGDKKDDDADGATASTTTPLNKSSVTLVPGTKPLKNYRFYLDVKSHITSSKLENKIKELGGVLELFLVKEVTHVVTDKEVWENASKGGGSIPKTPQTPSSQQSCFYSDHGTPEHSNAPSRGGRPKTRADAMLEKARKTTPITVAAKDPLVQAKQWGVKVCAVETVLQWLEKVSEALRKRSSRHHLQHRRYKVVELKAPYVKYEAFDRKHRPVFKELRNWPTFNFAAFPGSKGLVHQIQSADEQNNMTRRSRQPPPQELLFTRGLGAAQAAAEAAVAIAITAEAAAVEVASLATAATIASLHKPNRHLAIAEQQRQEPLPQQSPQQSPLSGFCEVCRIDYKDIEVHIFDNKHIAFVKDESNFVELDKLIKDSASLETFLKSNGIDEIVANRSNPTSSSPNAATSSVTTTKTTTSAVLSKMPRTRTSSLSDREKSNCPLAPVVNERLLRTTRRAALANNLIANTADEEPPVKPEGAKEVRELRSAHKSTTPKATSSAAASQYSETWDSGRPKRLCNLKQKRLHSSDDDDDDDDDEEDEVLRVGRPKVRKEVDDNEVDHQRQSRIAFEPRTFYKVNHPESSGQSTSKMAIKEQQEVATTKNKSAIIVKFRRMRTSELKQLNNEAENFLFPKRDDDESDDDDNGRDGDDDIDALCPDTTASTARGETSLAIISDVEEEDEEENHHVRRRRRVQDVINMDDNQEEVEVTSPGNSSSSPSTKKRKKRMTHAEAFIQDNKKYYKFETPGSRLRHQGVFMPTAKVTRGNGAKLAAADKATAVAATITKEESKTRTTGARRRRKRSSSSGGGGGGDGDNSGRLNLKELQFAFERVPKSEPWYQTFSRQDQGEEYYTCFSDSGYWKPFLLPYEMGPIPPLDPKVCISSYRQLKKHILEEVASNSAGVCSTPDSCSNEEETTTLAQSEDSNSLDECCVATTKRGRKRRRRCVVVSGRNPRKSPRQHASTLAILSTLMPHRKKRERERSSRNLLQVIPESKPLQPSAANTEVVDGERKKVGGDNIDDILSGAMDALGHFDHIDIQSEEEVSLRFTSNAIDSLQDYENYKHLENSKSGHLRRCYSPGKKPGRKKKKNRTGWPNKNNRNKHRKEVVHEDDSAPTEEDEDEEEEDDKDEVEVRTPPPPPPVNNRKPPIDQSVHKKSSESGKKSDMTSSVVLALDEEERPLSDRAIDLDRWENAEKVLTAKVSNQKELQPTVRMQKIIDEDGDGRGAGVGDGDFKTTNNRRLRSSSSPHRTNVKRQRRMPASPRSPRVLRKPRGRWYRER